MGMGWRAPASVSGSRPPSVTLKTCAPMSSRGSKMRFIGRVRRLASPSKVAVTGQPPTAPMTRRQPVPELPKSNAPLAFAHALDRGAQRTHRLAGVDDILAFEQAGYAGFPDRERAEDEAAVRDRFVAGDACAALQRACAARGERGFGGVVHGMSRLG